jgi:hypothetical protein
MYTRTTRSGTEKHPKPKDVFLPLLTRLINGNHQVGWAHFEWREHVGWFKNAFRGIPPFLEVALDDNLLELNLGLPPKVKDEKEHCESRGLPVPDSWITSDGLKVPTSEVEALSDWIQEYFVKIHECPADYMVNGYLDGI